MLLFFVCIPQQLATTVHSISSFPQCLFPFFSPVCLFPRPLSSQIGSGIGRTILKEEMKARSGSYDNDPWGRSRNSRCGSKETLNTTGYGTTAYNNTVNGCKDPPSAPFASPSFVSCSWCFCKFRNTTSKCISVQPCPFQCDHISCHGGFL